MPRRSQSGAPAGPPTPIGAHRDRQGRSQDRRPQGRRPRPGDHRSGPGPVDARGRPAPRSGSRRSQLPPQTRASGNRRPTPGFDPRGAVREAESEQPPPPTSSPAADADLDLRGRRVRLRARPRSASTSSTVCWPIEGTSNVLSAVVDAYRRTRKPKDIFWNRFVARPLAAVVIVPLARTARDAESDHAGDAAGLSGRGGGDGLPAQLGMRWCGASPSSSSPTSSTAPTDSWPASGGRHHQSAPTSTS